MNASFCYTCGSCDGECPVNRRTGSLYPRKIIRYFLLGLSKEGAKAREIWYCIRCGRCSNVCPMTVKPVDVIRFVCDIAVEEGVVSQDLFDYAVKTRERLHRARYGGVISLLYKAEDPDPSSLWSMSESGESPKRVYVDFSVSGERTKIIKEFKKYMDFYTNVTSCLSCGSCTNACPVGISRDILSPMHIVRLINWGLVEEAMKEPGIWLCIDCGRCIEVCPQNVKGLWVIRLLRNLSMKTGFTNTGFFERWRTLDKNLYTIFKSTIDNVV